MSELSFPPAMTGEAVEALPEEVAVAKAISGVDAGLVTWRAAADRVGAALVLAPEVPLRRAMAMLPLAGVGFQNALGALAPPEVAVHLEWGGAIRVNGARCGMMRAFAATRDPEAVPDWLVISWSLDLLPVSMETGHDPDRTALFVEGCADVDPALLVEAWARHTLAWIARWEDPDGLRALASEWRGLVHGVGEDVTRGDVTGTFLGVDEEFGMLLRLPEGTQVHPLTELLEETP
ncbi:biotin/lipoate--protein ligase family protein [Sagittula salina]|uniref:DUF4444 domain-containing protein n=1 Tax=Sagittula salina TaxID=2820268 RepID=A0A940S536_9RHOB|nr:biotin/lipoate--protein ligase family protein [Sagittula salina]MBP0484744.1 DUF4444 domain-containing protein [Sagittula salina]